ncbi:MAG: phosphopantothenoylcysteine decarboxylase, partial [Actinobacteria bacterium]|nr:phosphopantothenoylcysteine decarboxylase [Actinomycetota bacterium]
AETADHHDHLIELGRSKLARKGCDLLVVNEVGTQEVFGSTENSVVILGSDGSLVQIDRSSKAQVADALWDLVAPRVS